MAFVGGLGVADLRVRRTAPFVRQRRRPAVLRMAAVGPRVGHGFDLHRLEPDNKLILAGVVLDHTVGCVGHSDGDAVYHCVVDSVLGALSMPDIGQLFPDKDPQWKGAPSDVFMRATKDLMEEKGYEIGNLDVTVILEKPKLSPHKDKMRANIAELLDCDLDNVNLKAKTHEKVDALGENRAVACHTVVMLVPRPLAHEAQSTVAQATAVMVDDPKSLAQDWMQMASKRVMVNLEAGTAAVREAEAAIQDDHVLQTLYETIKSRKGADPSSSWTAKLFSKGRSKISQKVGEEGTEVVIAGIRDDKSELIKESADLLYHLEVLWADAGVEPDEVWDELRSRENTSGIAEKQSRSS
ncbi:hypothetical protein NDN08_001382 [Rhodosorus marinus]|uniref:2-C-methyl-D-erythritol 2,4-cyclodiphosphate synthase n=1 Tax=Rhodosorus marinus TaxID=101924 RepID=A0AAV8UUT6_9RHOD|nr:hypothetical protein NDN08_001382 [Rhodosorus marinus]